MQLPDLLICRKYKREILISIREQPMVTDLLPWAADRGEIVQHGQRFYRATLTVSQGDAIPVLSYPSMESGG